MEKIKSINEKKDEKYLKISFFQDLILKKILYDLKKKSIPYLESKFEEFKELFDFENEFSEKKIQKFFKKNPNDLTDYFNKLKSYELLKEESTQKSNDFIFISDGVYCFEIYDSADDKSLLSMFKKLEEIGACDQENNYELCKQDLRKCCKEIQDRTYLRSDKSFRNYYIPIKSDFFDKVYINFYLFSNNLFRLTYFFSFKDDYRYLLHNYFTYGVKSKIQLIKRNFGLSYTIKYIRADKRIRDIYSSFIKSYYYEIKNFIINNVPGVLYNLLNEIPCSVRYFFDHPRYFKKIHGFLFSIDYETTSAFNYLLDYNEQNKDRYIESEHGSAFIPIEPKSNNYSDLIMIHACKLCEIPVYIQTTNLSWLSIIDYLFFKQYEASKSILRIYNYFDLNNGKVKINFTKDKNTINRINSIIQMFETEIEYLIRVNKKKTFSFVSQKYSIEISEKKKIKYFKEYISRIKYRKKTLMKMVEQLNIIHNDRFQEQNIKTNTFLQKVITVLTVITVILTIITIRITINQKENDKKETESDNTVIISGTINDEQTKENIFSEFEEIVIPEF